MNEKKLVRIIYEGIHYWFINCLIPISVFKSKDTCTRWINARRNQYGKHSPRGSSYRCSKWTEKTCYSGVHWFGGSILGQCCFSFFKCSEFTWHFFYLQVISLLRKWWKGRSHSARRNHVQHSVNALENSFSVNYESAMESAFHGR